MNAIVRFTNDPPLGGLQVCSELGLDLANVLSFNSLSKDLAHLD